MLDIQFIRENKEKVKEVCQNKEIDLNVERILELDKKRRELIQRTEGLRSQQKKIGKSVV